MKTKQPLLLQKKGRENETKRKRKEKKAAEKNTKTKMSALI